MTDGEPLRTACGMRCDICPAFVENRASADLQKASLMWAELFDVHLTAEAIKCGGCRGDRRDLLDQDCPVRPCVLERGLNDCSQCGEMPCDNLKRRWVSREDIETRLGHSIPEDDFRRFVLPFENAPWLSAQRGRRS